MTVVNVKLTGELESFVDAYIRSGYATSKTEVIRMGLIKLKEQEHEDISDDPELEKYLMDIKSGKIKPKMYGPVKRAADILK
jgi:Arc/MetJ-type ribon-helix-helix transcriptional regulator